MIQLSDRLTRVLSPALHDDAVDALRTYFTPRPVGKYSGAHFERLGGGGDRPEVADHLTAEDLVAVSTLSVSISGDAAIEILETRRERLHCQLRLIPTDRTLSDLTLAALGPDWPVRSVYRELMSIRSIGETSATKLLARKRPHLVPILDSVVTQELGIVHGNFWIPLHDWLTRKGRANHAILDRLRADAGLGPEISVLRVFDVLAWMTGRGYIHAAATPATTRPAATTAPRTTTRGTPPRE